MAPGVILTARAPLLWNYGIGIMMSASCMLWDNSPGLGLENHVLQMVPIRCG